MTEFEIDTGGLISYAKTLRDAERRVNWATAYYLTELAVRCRDEQQRAIEGSMIVRDARFVKKHLVWQKALGRQKAAAQVARAGSWEQKRFSGWKEQVEGGTKKRVAMHKARVGNSRLGRMLKRNMLRPGNPLPSQHSIPIRATSEAHRVFIFLRIMSRRPKAPFALASGHPTLEPGVWILEGSHGKDKWPRPVQLQEFGAEKEVKRNDWNKEAKNDTTRSVNTATLWRQMWEKSGVMPKKKTCK